jgi:NAD(P)-dependent dehydrogenase (short-subunit alcohol dehydrogenase family)
LSDGAIQVSSADRKNAAYNRTESVVELNDKIAVVTGGANGIGKALCERFAEEGARAVVVADLDFAAAQDVAKSIAGNAMYCDVGCESDVRKLVDETMNRFGRIDLFCSNAGITVKGGLESSNDDWQRMWDVNVMSRVFAARAVVPAMLKNGSGYLLHTASAAALVTEIGSATYSVTKQADLALTEWIAVQYGRQGIGVSCLCPLGVETDMLDHDDPIHQFLQLQSITPQDVAESVVDGLREESFLILPHPQVTEFFQMKAADHDRWVSGMQRLNEKLTRRLQRQAA